MNEINHRPKAAEESFVNACAEFESNWCSGAGRNSVESFLEKWGSEFDQSKLLIRLVKCEIELKRRSGAVVDRCEYQNRFPALDSEVLENLFSMPAPPRSRSIHAPLLPKRYKVAEQIGKGGIGSVWRVIDREMNRPLAAKILLDKYKQNSAANARLQREALLAGTLQHPGIPPVFELGDLVTGSKYFTMKLVEGKTLDQILGSRSNPADDQQQTLNVFRQIAETVGFAHSKGVIHRDLKPQNVMVGEFGEVQIMDWGMAKHLAELRSGPQSSSAPLPQKITPQKDDHETNSMSYDSSLLDGGDANALTMQGDIVGTPMYMSPEQARGELENLSERSDVFSLGSILFEILTSQRLFQDSGGNVLKAAATADVSGVIERLNSTDIDPGLIAICKSCLEPAAKDRLENGQAVAIAIANHLDSVALRLRAAEVENASVEIRLAESSKRRRQATWLTSAIVTAILIGLVGVIWQWNRAANSAAAAAISAQESTKSADRSADVLNIVTNAFGSVDPNTGSDSTMMAKDVLVNARSALKESELDVEGRMLLLDNLAGCFRELGEYELAAKSYEEWIDLHEETLQPEDQSSLKTMNALALVYLDMGRLDDSLVLQEKVFELQKVVLGPDHEDTMRSINNLGLVHEKAGRYKKALALYESLFELQESKGEKHPDTISWMTNLALVYNHLGRIDDAVKLGEQLLEHRKAKLGEDHPKTMLSMNNLSQSYKSLGRFEEALEMAQATFELVKVKFGDEHPNTLIVMGNVGLAYESLGRFDEAVAINEKAMALKKAVFGLEHPETLVAMNNLACALRNAGRLDESLELHKETLKLQTAKLGETHTSTMSSMQNLADVYSKLGVFEKALALTEKTLLLRRTELGDEHPATLISMNNLAAVYTDVGRYDESLELYTATLELKKAKFGNEHPETLATMNGLAGVYADLGRLEDALELQQKALEVTSKTLGHEHPRTLISMSNVALVMRRLGQIDKALELFEQTWVLQKEVLGEDHGSTLSTRCGLAICYRSKGQLEKAISILEEVQVKQTEALGKQHPDTLDTLGALSNAYLLSDQLEKALAVAESCWTIKKKWNPDHWTTFDTQTRYGEVLFRIGRIEESANHLQQGYEGMKLAAETISGSHRKEQLANALKLLIELGKSQDQPESIKRWQAELNALGGRYP